MIWNHLIEQLYIGIKYIDYSRQVFYQGRMSLVLLSVFVKFQSILIKKNKVI